MRTIKFRVYILDKNGKVECHFHEWLDGDGWKHDYYAPLVTNGVFSHEELGDGFFGEIVRKQFTGLNDKNKVDCYEKDYDEDGNMIDWCDECCGYQFKMIDIPTGDEVFCHNCDGNFMLQDHIGDFKIVGNRCELKSGRHEA